MMADFSRILTKARENEWINGKWRRRVHPMLHITIQGTLLFVAATAFILAMMKTGWIEPVKTIERVFWAYIGWLSGGWYAIGLYLGLHRR